MAVLDTLLLANLTNSSNVTVPLDTSKNTSQVFRVSWRIFWVWECIRLRNEGRSLVMTKDDREHEKVEEVRLYMPARLAARQGACCCCCCCATRVEYRVEMDREFCRWYKSAQTGRQM